MYVFEVATLCNYDCDSNMVFAINDVDNKIPKRLYIYFYSCWKTSAPTVNEAVYTFCLHISSCQIV